MSKIVRTQLLFRSATITIHEKDNVLLEYQGHTRACKYYKGVCEPEKYFFSFAPPLQSTLTAPECQQIFLLPFEYPEQLIVEICDFSYLPNDTECQIKNLRILTQELEFSSKIIPIVCTKACIVTFRTMVQAKHAHSNLPLLFSIKDDSFSLTCTTSVAQLCSWNHCDVRFNVPGFLHRVLLNMTIHGHVDADKRLILSYCDAQNGFALHAYCYTFLVQIKMARTQSFVENMQFAMGNAVLSFKNGSVQNNPNVFILCDLHDSYASLLELMCGTLSLYLTIILSIMRVHNYLRNATYLL